jgi:hypothetical protein
MVHFPHPFIFRSQLNNPCADEMHLARAVYFWTRVCVCVCWIRISRTWTGKAPWSDRGDAAEGLSVILLKIKLNRAERYYANCGAGAPMKSTKICLWAHLWSN